MRDAWWTSFSDWYRENHMNASLDEVEEEFDLTAIPTKRVNKHDILIGRFQPFHAGHLAVVEQMNNPMIVIIRGEKSSKELDRNPLDEREQIQLIKKAAPKARVVVAKTGYLPDIFVSLRESSGMEVRKVYAGEDRMASYERQINSINQKLDENAKFDLEFITAERTVAATDVRTALAESDEVKYKEFMPSCLWEDFEWLSKKIISQSETNNEII